MADKLNFHRKSAQKKNQAPSSQIELISQSSAVAPDQFEVRKIAQEAAREIAEKVAFDVAEKKVDDEVEKRQARYTEILGVFVALFTFVSINFQIFSQIDTLNYAIVLILLLFLCLTGFIALAHFILTDIGLKKKSHVWIVITVIPIITLVLLVIFLKFLPPMPIASVQSQIKENVKLLEYRIGRLE